MASFPSHDPLSLDLSFPYAHSNDEDYINYGCLLQEQYPYPTSWPEFTPDTMSSVPMADTTNYLWNASAYYNVPQEFDPNQFHAGHAMVNYVGM